MTKEYQDRYDPNKPALIVLYGATKRKFRPLESDVVVLGRAPGCDIGLVSGEVAPVHCIVVRGADGWRVRDCSGRATRLNGKAIHDEPLHNGDTLQIGTFSFEAQLPPVAAPVAAVAQVANAAPVAQVCATPYVAPDVQRLQASRRRLAELAIGLRRRLREQSSEAYGERGEVARLQADLEVLERRLRKTREEQLARQAAQAEQQKQLERRAEELDRYSAHLRRQAALQRAEGNGQPQPLEPTPVQQLAKPNPSSEELARLHAELEVKAEQLAREVIREREQLNRDREELDRERHALSQQRIELERHKEQQAEQTPLPTTRETTFDAPPGSRLESARKLLRELADRRKATEASKSRGKKSRTRQARPAIGEKPA